MPCGRSAARAHLTGADEARTELVAEGRELSLAPADEDDVETRFSHLLGELEADVAGRAGDG